MLNFTHSLFGFIHGFNSVLFEQKTVMIFDLTVGHNVTVCLSAAANYMMLLCGNCAYFVMTLCHWFVSVP